MDDAKMIGITPDALTLIGRWVDWPPYILRPTTRLAYWTGMRRSALDMNTMNTTTARPMMIIRTADAMPVPPLVNRLASVDSRDGPREMMPANRMIEMPLPMPFWVMCSPSHMISAVPAVKVRMIAAAASTPSLDSMLPVPKPLRSIA